MNDYTILVGWNPVEVEAVVIVAETFHAACVAARIEYGRSWSYVGVVNLDDGTTTDVAHRRTDGDMDPVEWVTRKLAPPAEVAVVSIDQFLAALQPQVLAVPGPTSSRAVWILIDGMLYTPMQIGLDPEFGAILIVPSSAPAGTYGMARQPPDLPTTERQS